MNTWFLIRTFIAFFFVLFGVAYMAGAAEERALLGAFFAALGLTFFWRLWVAIRTGM
jgi:hypothetical protein